MAIETIGAASASRIDKSYTPADTAPSRTATASSIGVATAQKNDPEPSRAQLDQAVSELNQSSQIKTQGLEFAVDEDSQRTVVKVIDQETKEVLRQIPTKEALALAKAFDSAKGSLISQSA
ncbi:MULTISPECIES: flagellar protein FlaG [Janthinobacterium]|uniref:Flagellar protein FlaG n=1 Tax=Janthinobacterium lividum TaxID=29581 RepID=A0AAJ4MR28_9BURK|nr:MULTISPECIES: flagellar protein FlaG [Janthinobacterium]KAB0326433.1 flagellar protein FlaG [Janthinobacterium lividum]QKY10547.1 flagellar protein FlaG [Janthinobacterium lividum]QSX95564.1 flagellar protein FlaG [Janthinobacterium lividum]UGQ35409.1 flagellar protein FlaG [Janthinobacterium sp. PLB04]